jgi:hypothetical protein
MTIKINMMMKVFPLQIWLLVFLLQASGNIAAQQMIILSDSLAAHAEVWDVRVDYPINKEVKFNMGDYTIISDPELNRTFNQTKERLMGLRIVSKTTKIFSFTISDESADTATVITEEKNRINAYYPNEVFEDFVVDEISGGKFESFGAWITVHGDSSKTWTLYVPKGRGKERRFPIEMLLTDGVKLINAISVSSDMYFDYAHPFRSMLKMPSMGVEFFENGVSICAVQYDAGAQNNYDFGGQNSFGCKAWMHNRLAPEFHLVLAAAMSTIILMNNPYLSMQD